MSMRQLYAYLNQKYFDDENFQIHNGTQLTACISSIFLTAREGLCCEAEHHPCTGTFLPPPYSCHDNLQWYYFPACYHACWLLYTLPRCVTVVFSSLQIVKQEWPRNWPTFISDIVGASKTSESLCTNNMAIFKLLRCVSDGNNDELASEWYLANEL